VPVAASSFCKSGKSSFSKIACKIHWATVVSEHCMLPGGGDNGTRHGSHFGEHDLKLRSNGRNQPEQITLHFEADLGR